MHAYWMSPFETSQKFLGTIILKEGLTSTGTKTWQSQDISHRPEMTPIELTNVQLQMQIPQTVEQMAEAVHPSLPWADEHFEERVGGQPLNPPPSHVRWPYARKDNEEHTEGGQFSHTYPERFWPKRAGALSMGEMDTRGIRYALGDLGDVVEQLNRDFGTRQAYLPVFFPEDTGAVAGQRVPCTLGYLFQIREGRMDITYHIRSCDFLRHFRDDVYMAMRLADWVRSKTMYDIDNGVLTMCIGSLHVFEGDRKIMEMKGYK